MWRCVNDIFGYCKNEPTWAKEPSEIVFERGSPDSWPTGHIGGSCSKNPLTCRRYRNFARVYPPKKNKAGSHSPVQVQEPG